MCGTILSWPLSFQFTDQLCRHYDNDKAHTDRMKRYGVEKLLVDERTRVKQKRRRTPSPDKVIYVHRTEYIIIDEWSEEVDKTDCEGKTRMEDEVMLHCHHCTVKYIGSETREEMRFTYFSRLNLIIFLEAVPTLIH